MASTISSLPVALPVVKASHKPSHAKPSSPKMLPAKPAALPKQIIDCKKSNINYKLAFSGPAPERINGRLAMVGFVSAIGVELVKGDGLMAQLANGGLPWFFYTTVLLSMAFWNTFETKFSPRHI